MSIENQVAQLLSKTEAMAEQLTTLQTTVAGIATPPAATVDLSPVTDAIAALDAKVTTVLADIADPADAPQTPSTPPAAPTGSGTAGDSAAGSGSAS